MSKILVETGAHQGELEVIGIIRKRPPKNCAMGCPEHQSSDICWTCYRRPIKSIERTVRPVVFRLDQSGEQITSITEA